MLSHIFNFHTAHKLPKDPILIVLGATGTGKSQLAVDLAKRFNGEIINGDAMQMYAGLPIITNKITKEEQQGISHHLLGHIQLHEEAWRVGVFQKETSNIIRNIRDRGKIPVVVGGTHYYIQSLLFGDSIIGENNSVEDVIQNSVPSLGTKESLAILDGPPELILKKLREVDPKMANRWHPNDKRKISRSLEIFLRTGERASDLYARQQELRDERRRKESESKALGEGFNPISTLIFWIHTEPEYLNKRLDARVLKMIDAGLLDEVKSMDKYLQTQQDAGINIDTGRGIWASIGWKEFKPYLDALKTGGNLETALNLSIQQTQAATRQYAKRQLRWIRLKLRPALAESNAWSERFFLLDGNNIANFQNSVTNKACEIAADFLAGKNPPLPKDISSIANTILSNSEKKPNVWFRETCKICIVTSMNEIEWEAHLKSRKHRGMVRKKLKTKKKNQDS